MATLAMDDPFFVARSLSWYKRRDVQEAILAACEQREVSPRFGQGFGKRPDALFYPADVLSLATRKATSFHCSEERWRDPLRLVTGSSRKELDDLRVGWDLVLDVDCPYWFFAKLTAHLFVQALRAHGLAGVSCKFSGGKGFHIGVPFEAFPAEVDGRPTATLFPEAPRALASYLLAYLADPSHGLILVKGDAILFDKRYRISFAKLREMTGKEAHELISETCRSCSSVKERVDASKALFLCVSCGHAMNGDGSPDYLRCERCNGVMEPHSLSRRDASRCRGCGSTEFEPRFNVAALIQVDTVLLASRHLFRTPYSLHEKSGLVSIVLSPERIMSFEKEEAKPETVKVFPGFLDPGGVRPGEAAALLRNALDFHGAAERLTERERKEHALPEEAIPEELFPPCMTNILRGLEDGKKRAMFALTNFLRTCGWGHDQIGARLEEWNKKNPEQLRDVVVKGHLRSLKTKREVYPPPNCRSFYQDLRVCMPDNFCSRIRNPAQYAKLKAELAAATDPVEGGKRPRARLTEEQKAMRRAYREKRRAIDSASRG